MWVQFAPPAMRWLMFGLFVLLVLGVLAMPKEERARMFRGARRRRTGRAFSSTMDAQWASPPDAGDAGASNTSHVALPESSASLRRLSAFALAARVVLVASAVVLLVLVAWMAIAFVLNLPGLR